MFLCYGLRKVPQKINRRESSCCDGRQGNLLIVFQKRFLLVRVKRWGKSPPLVWQQARHGKPRVVQGQIGGESRPGSPSKQTQVCSASSETECPALKRACC